MHRCSTCKRKRLTTDFCYDHDGEYRYASCNACLARADETYRERKGEPVSQATRARRWKRAGRVVEKALRARVRQERRKKEWIETRERWKQGKLPGLLPEQVESFRRGEEYCEGPYRQWVGYTDPREEGCEERGESTDEEDFTDKGESPGGSFTNERKSPQVEAGPVSDPQEEQVQFCSSCNVEKPLTDFGRSLTCSPCRERNKRAAQARRARKKAAATSSRG